MTKLNQSHVPANELVSQLAKYESVAVNMDEIKTLIADLNECHALQTLNQYEAELWTVYDPNVTPTKTN